MPYYDFTKGEKIFGTKFTRIDRRHIVIIEGIHALNEKLTEGIDDNEKFKIYISPFSPISIDHHNRIPTTDCRMLRRMVRDYQFRDRSVKQTIAEWPKVRAGEEKISSLTAIMRMFSSILTVYMSFQCLKNTLSRF